MRLGVRRPPLHLPSCLAGWLAGCRCCDVCYAALCLAPLGTTCSRPEAAKRATQQHPPNGAASTPAATRTRTRTQLGTRRRTQLADSGGSGITQNGGREMKLVPGVRSVRGVAQTSQSRHGNQSTRNPRRCELSRNQLSGFAVRVCASVCAWWCLPYATAAAAAVAAHKRVSFHIHAVIRELAMSAGSSQLAVYAVAS